jgi:hypothetical protein
VARLYRPLRGTEGMDFIAKWCGLCAKDDNDDCPILAASFVYEVDDPKYPNEWRYERDEPICTAFRASDPMAEPHMKSAAVKDLFPGSPKRPSQGQQVRMLVSARSRQEG